VYSGDSKFVTMYDVQEGLENAALIEELPHIAKSPEDRGNGVTSLAWDVSSLQTNISAPRIKDGHLVRRPIHLIMGLQRIFVEDNERSQGLS